MVRIEIADPDHLNILLFPCFFVSPCLICKIASNSPHETIINTTHGLRFFMNKINLLAFFLLTILCNICVAEENSKANSQSRISTKSAYLTVQNIQDDGCVLGLFDGSEWEIQYFGSIWRLFGWGWKEQKKFSHWSVGDNIEIQYPGSGNFVDFVLVLNNLSKREIALATLKRAPTLDYFECLQILSFDKETNHFMLSDGTFWLKTTTNMYGAFLKNESTPPNEWEPGDPVTLIRGEGWLNSKTFFLWNHRANEMPLINRIEF